MVFLLMIAVGVIGANSLILSPIAAEVALGLGVANPADVMNAAAMYGGGVALSALFLAPMADRIGADQALKLSMILVAAALGVSAAAPNMTTLIVAQALTGVGVGMALPAIYTMAAVIAPKGQEARIIGKVLTGWTLSMVGGVTFSAYAAEIFGWRAVFALLALGVSALLITLYAIAVPAAPRSGKVTSPISGLRVPGISRALISVAVTGTGFYGVYNYLGTHISSALDRPISDSGWFTLSYGIGFAAAMLFDPLMDRIGVRRGLAVVFSLLIPLYLMCVAVIDQYLPLCLLMAVWGVLNHLGLNLTVGRLSQLDESQRGAIMGLNSAVMYLSVFGATTLYRPVFNEWGLGACYLLSVGVALLGLVEALSARRQARRLHAATA